MAGPAQQQQLLLQSAAGARCSCSGGGGFVSPAAVRSSSATACIAGVSEGNTQHMDGGSGTEAGCCSAAIAVTAAANASRWQSRP